MDAQKKPKIIAIVGPTASGKTSLSLLLAQKYNGEIISADSRQVYKGLDIGTEKITTEEMSGIPHHLISVVDVNDIYTAQRFKEDADTAIKNITSRGNLPIVTGGTFFYIDTLLRKISSPEVQPDIELRAKLEKKSTDELYTELESKDAVRASSIDRFNKRRIMRALEILHVLPSVPKPVALENPYDVLTIGITVDKDVLRERLRKRAERALEKGLVEETQNLLTSGVSKERLSEIGLEYRLVLDLIDGTISKEQLILKLEEKNWQYAKRQLMWLKRDTSIKWFEREDTSSIYTAVENFLRK